MRTDLARTHPVLAENLLTMTMFLSQIVSNIGRLNLDAHGQPIEAVVTQNARHMGVTRTLAHAWWEANDRGGLAAEKQCWMIMEYCDKGTLVVCHSLTVLCCAELCCAAQGLAVVITKYCNAGTLVASQLSFFSVLCCAVLCCAMSCYVALCHTTLSVVLGPAALCWLCHNRPCCAVLCCAVLSHDDALIWTMLCCAGLCRALLLCETLLCCATPCYAVLTCP